MIDEDAWELMFKPKAPAAKRHKAASPPASSAAAAATADDAGGDGDAAMAKDGDDGDGEDGDEDAPIVRLPVPKHIMAEGASIDYTAASGSVYKCVAPVTEPRARRTSLFLSRGGPSPPHSSAHLVQQRPPSPPPPARIKHTGDHYYCTCMAWRNQGAPVNARTCKHLRAYLGDGASRLSLQAATPPECPPRFSQRRPCPLPQNLRRRASARSRRCRCGRAARQSQSCFWHTRGMVRRQRGGTHTVGKRPPLLSSSPPADADCARHPVPASGPHRAPQREPTPPAGT